MTSTLIGGPLYLAHVRTVARQAHRDNDISLPQAPLCPDCEPSIALVQGGGVLVFHLQKKKKIKKNK